MSAKSIFKRLFKTAFFRSLICALAAWYIRLVYYTSRKHMDVESGAEPYVSGEKQAVMAFWHGRLLMMGMICPPKRKMQILISTHRDGEMIARTMHHFGFGTVRGSSTRGGITAAMNAVRALQAGDNVSVTPDGPRGPLMQVQPGLLTIAEMARVPVIPVTYSAHPHKRMKTWDRFMLALPFGSIYYKVGAPMMNATREALEAKMVQLTQAADEAVHV